VNDSRGVNPGRLKAVNGQAGFTLIELMIVIAVLGILAAVAYPSYVESVQKSRRADAQSVLLEAAQLLERFHTENNGSYAAFTLPAYLQNSPKDGATKYYTITATGLAASTYLLTATPSGAQVGDRCANLTFNNLGVKGTSSAQTDCWRK
jgi:type IV pilus assembly protein PilE